MPRQFCRQRWRNDNIFMELLWESDEWFIKDQAYLPSYGLAPTQLPPSLSRQCARHTGRQRKTGEGGKTWGRSQIIRRRESLVLNKSFNTLWQLTVFKSNFLNSWYRSSFDSLKNTYQIILVSWIFVEDDCLNFCLCSYVESMHLLACPREKKRAAMWQSTEAKIFFFDVLRGKSWFLALSRNQV